MPEVTSRSCSKCKIVKPFTEFHRAPKFKFGVYPSCKACCIIERARVYKANRTVAIAKAKEWKDKNPERALASQRKCRAANVDKHKRYMKAWQAENRMPKPTEWVSKGQLYRHNISLDAFLDLLKRQRYSCAACKAKFQKTGDRYYRPYIDHDHSCCPSGDSRSCGRCIRGLLCHMCNLALGHVYNSSHRLRQLANYMDSTKPFLYEPDPTIDDEMLTEREQ